MARACLLYVVDPMCSWCQGFTSVAKAPSRQTAADDVVFHLVAGGLCADRGAAPDSNTRGYILDHWQTVQQATGQSSHFGDALPEGFVYDTEPACRTLVVARSLDEESAWPLVRATQRAFYARGRDAAQAAVLADLAEAVGIPRVESAAAFDSGEVYDATVADFAWTQDLGITGFPILLAERNGQLALPANGYQLLAEPSPLPGRWLERGRHE